MKNYYEILEVNRKASKEVIDKAYKVLIKKYHPDLYEGEKQKYAERKTKEINEAYRVLSNDFLKEQYDDELEIQIRKEIRNDYTMQKQEQDQLQQREAKQEETETPKKNKIGTFDSIVELTKNMIHLMKNKEKREEIKEVTKKDIMALVLTIIVVIIIGIILWFIPFTNSWMKELLFENPLFSWIGFMFK